MNLTHHRRNPFLYHQIAGGIPAGPEVRRSTMAALANALTAQQSKSGQVVQHEARQLTGLYNGMSSQLRKQVWNGRNLNLVPPTAIPDTVRNRQVVELLARFDGLFRFWGIRFPVGMAKGRHLWTDDITNSARMAFFQAFIPHCEVGAADCHSEETTSRKLLYTATGRIMRRVQPVTDSAGVTVCHRLKPVYRIRKEFSPSCNKAAIHALKAGKFAAMRAARKFTRHGLKETTFSSLDLKPGQSVENYLEGLGENPAIFANEIGINSPWLDHTLQKLSQCLSSGQDRVSISHSAIRSAVAKCEAIDGRVNKALRIANDRGLISSLFLRMAGLQWHEVAILEGINLPALKVKLYRLRAEIKRAMPAA